MRSGRGIGPEDGARADRFGELFPHRWVDREASVRQLLGRGSLAEAGQLRNGVVAPDG